MDARVAARKASDTGSFAVALLLAGLAGWVDAIGITQTHDMFLAFMSGNTTNLAVAMVHRDWPKAAFIGVIILLFVAGVTLGEAVKQSAGWHGSWLVLGLEAVCLGIGAVVFADGFAPYPLVLAMGLQNATMHRAGGINIGLTYVTGTLVQIGRALAGGQVGRAGEYLVVWISLALGAGCAGLVLSVAPVAALAAAAVVAALLAVGTVVG